MQEAVRIPAFLVDLTSDNGSIGDLKKETLATSQSIPTRDQSPDLGLLSTMQSKDSVCASA